MSFSRHIDSAGILITRLSGAIPFSESIQLQNELIDFLPGEEIYEMVLHTDDAKIIQNSHESELSAENATSALKKYKRGAIAFVSSDDFAFGLLRQLQMRVGNDFIQMAVFRKEKTALSWLKEMKSSNDSKSGVSV